MIGLFRFSPTTVGRTVAGGRARLNGSRDEEGEREEMTNLVLAGALGLGPAALKAVVLGGEDVAAAGGALPVAGADVAAAAAATAAAPAAAAVAAAAAATLLVFSQSHPHTACKRFSQVTACAAAVETCECECGCLFLGELYRRTSDCPTAAAAAPAAAALLAAAAVAALLSAAAVVLSHDLEVWKPRVGARKSGGPASPSKALVAWTRMGN